MRLIAHISDLHFGRHDPSMVDGLVHSLDQNRPDLVAVSGDLTQRARHTEFTAARHFLDRIGRPIVVVPGNHDVPLYAVHRRFLQPYKKFNRHIAPSGVADSFFPMPSWRFLASIRHDAWSGKTAASLWTK